MIVPRNGPRGLSGFLDGAGCYLRALAFLRDHPRLLPLVIIPFLLTIGLFVGVGVFGWLVFDGWKDDFLASHSTGFWSWPGVQWLLVVAFLLVFGLACLLSFVSVGSLVTSPFSEFLSQRAERMLLGESPPQSGGLGSLVRDALRGLKHECVRLGFYAALYLLLLPLAFVPLIGQALFVVGITIVSIRYLAWDAVDYCLSRRRLAFRTKLAFLRAHRAHTLGLGTMSFVLLAIPLTTIFVLPLNALAGTILFVRIEKHSFTLSPPG